MAILPRRWLRVGISALNGFVAGLAVLSALYIAGVPADVRSPASGRSLDAVIIVMLMSIAVVCGYRALDGRFAIPLGKDRVRISSSAAAVLLWALCFALISTFALLSGILQRWPQAPVPWQKSTMKEHAATTVFSRTVKTVPR
jgi:hypothetical protein